QVGVGSLREAYWHDAKRLWLIGRLICQEREQNASKRRNWRKRLPKDMERLDLFRQHAVVFLKNFTNLGRGAALGSHWTNQEAESDPSNVLGYAKNGYQPMGPRVIEGKELARFEASCAKLQQEPTTRLLLGSVANSTLETMLAAFRGAGAEPLMLISPAPFSRVYYPGKASAVSMLDFSNVSEWPQLFGREYRADTAHLNTRGSAIYTRLLAERFIALKKTNAVVSEEALPE
ncbi:MAG: hypothetical protein V4710_11405, partial [Verrucomicrobiota bacterium]